jgi:hypothetical protein
LQALTTNATDLGTPGRDTLYGYGLVRADSAVLSILQNRISKQPLSTPTTTLEIVPAPLPNTTAPTNLPFISPTTTDPRTPGSQQSPLPVATSSPTTTPQEKPTLPPITTPPSAPSTKPQPIFQKPTQIIKPVMPKTPENKSRQNFEGSKRNKVHGRSTTELEYQDESERH